MIKKWVPFILTHILWLNFIGVKQFFLNSKWLTQKNLSISKKGPGALNDTRKSPGLRDSKVKIWLKQSGLFLVSFNAPGPFVFLGRFWAFVGQPHCHIGWATSMPFASINSTNRRTNQWNFHKNIENWQFWKTQFFWVGWFDFFFQYFFFASSPWKLVTNFVLERMGLLWWFTGKNECGNDKRAWVYFSGRRPVARFPKCQKAWPAGCYSLFFSFSEQSPIQYVRKL